MTSTQTDRRNAASNSVAYKAPCRAATTAAITLNGEQTIDGVAVVTGDRVLVKNQTTTTENGIWECDTGDWTRTPDADGAGDVVTGTTVFVTAGTVSAGLWYYCSTTGTIIMGTSANAWSATNPGNSLTVPVPLTQGGTGQTTADTAATALGIIKLTGAGGTANVQTATAPANLAAHAANQLYEFTPSVTNTSATTLTITPSGSSALAARNVFAGGAACAGGEIASGVPLLLLDDGTRLNIIGRAPFVDTSTLVVGSADATKKMRLEVDNLSTGTTRALTVQDQNYTIAADFQGAIKNRIINPDGAIYQRAVAATADDAYFADRWYILSQTGTVTPSVLTDPEDGFPKGVRITQSQASAQRFGFAQIIEGKNCKDLRGQSGVLVPRLRISNSQAIRYAILGWTSTEDAVTSDVVLDWTSASYTAGGFFLAANLSVIAVGSQTPSANTWTSLTQLTAALGSTFNNIVVFAWTEGTAAQNVTLDFDYVQFERGSYGTAFERRGFALELEMCQRYYEKSYDLASAPAAASTAGLVVVGGGGSASNMGGGVKFKTRKRATSPTMLYWDGAGNSNKATQRNGAATTNNVGTVAGVSAGETSAILDTGLTSQVVALVHFTAEIEL